MATLDQLPAQQRAIVELVLKRGQSYDELADMLNMPATRVRELAREALAELSPITARRVDPEWRGQLADYILGQQSGPESTATRGHLRRSEAARSWTRSLLDSLDTFYADGLPTVPEGEREPRGRARERRRRAPRKPAAEPAERKRPLRDDQDSTVRRRRLLAAVAAAAVVLFALLVFPIGLLTGDDEEGDGGGGEQAQAEARIVGQLPLQAVDGANAQGIAAVADRGGTLQLIVRAQLSPSRRGEAYEVWLYNSQGDARSIGAQVTDQQGVYQGAGRLPANYRSYRFIDISREKIDQNRAHSGESVLRGQLDQLQAPQPTAQGGQGATPQGQGTAPQTPAPPGD